MLHHPVEGGGSHWPLHRGPRFFGQVPRSGPAFQSLPGHYFLHFFPRKTRFFDGVPRLPRFSAWGEPYLPVCVPYSLCVCVSYSPISFFFC